MLFIILTILVVFLPSKKYTEFISKNTTLALKGLLAILILLHHTSQCTEDYVIFSPFKYLGIYCVALFLFLSGYGLMQQYKLKGEKYLENFFRKRFLKVFIPIFIISFLHFLIKLFYFKDLYGFIMIYDYFRHGYTLIINGWYLNAIIYLYVSFFISFRYLKGYKTQNLVLLFFTILYVYITYSLNYGLWWYSTIFAFNFGFLISTFEEKLLEIINKKYKIITLIFSAIFFILDYFEKNIMLSLSEFIPNVDNYIFIYKNIACIFCIISTLLILKSYRINFKILNFFGKISFEFYMVHGILLALTFNNFGFRYRNVFIVYIIIFAVSVLFNDIFNKLYKKMNI